MHHVWHRSYGAVACQASSIPESFFMVAAEAVAQSLDSHDIEAESVVPHPARIRQVAQNVATAVVLAAQEGKLAGKHLGDSAAEVTAAIAQRMWSPHAEHEPPPPMTRFRRSSIDFGGEMEGCRRIVHEAPQQEEHM